MKDREPIGMAETLHELETPLSGPEQFVAEGVSGLAGEMVRRSVGPALDIDRNLLAKNPARALSQIPVEDPNLRFTREELTRPSAETISLAVPLALAKAQAVEREFHLTPKEKRAVSTFKSKARKAALGLATFSLVATACTSEAKPTVNPTPFNTEPVATEVLPTETPTTEPAPELLTTATETFTPFTPPVNPPEYGSEAGGGPFPEGIREQAEIDRYRAFLVLARQEGRTIFGATDEEIKQQLNAFAEETNTQVKQEWNGKFGDEYQMVSVNIRTHPDGSQTVFWFATPGGALSARPDIPSLEESTLAPISIEAGYHPEFRWGEDGNIYMYQVNSETGKAEEWFNTTVPASHGEELAGEWSLTKERIAELAEDLKCGFSGCVFEVGIGEKEPHVDVISSGMIKSIDFFEPTSGEFVGQAQALVAVTKDAKNSPKLVYVVVQLTSSENPSVNLVPGIINYLAEKWEDMDNSTIYSMEELEKILSAGELSTFGFSKKSYPSEISNKIIEQVYGTADYLEALVSFVESRGEIIKTDPFIIFPDSLLFR